MERDGTTDSALAAAQLAALRADRAVLADRVVQPWWWDVALGLAVAGFLGTYASRTWWLVGVAGLAFLAVVAGLVLLYTRLTGVRLSAARADAPQRPLQVWAGCCLGWVVVTTVALAVDAPALVLAASALMGVGAAVVSRWWTTGWVTRLRDRP